MNHQRQSIALSLALSCLCLWSAPNANATNKGHSFNVKTYGAKGDGVTDDSAAIEKALAAATPGSGSIVVFPPGVYLITQQITVNGLQLIGPGATLLEGDTTAELLVTGKNSFVEFFEFEHQPGVQMHNAIHISSAVNATINDCNFFPKSSQTVDTIIRVENSADGLLVANTVPVINQGIYLTNSTNTSIQKNTLNFVGDKSQRTGIRLEKCIGPSVRHNIVHGTGGHFQTVHGLLDIDGTNSNILQNSFDHVPTAILLTGPASPKINDNEISNGDGAIDIRGASGIIDIEGNTAKTLSGSAINMNIGSGNATTHVKVQGNTVSGANYGILYISLKGPVTIAANVVADINNTGIFLAGSDGTGSRVINNNLRNCGLNRQSGRSVISVNLTSSDPYFIEGNQYQAPAASSTPDYFISTEQSAPIAQVSGNRTNTLLPNKIGP